MFQIVSWGDVVLVLSNGHLLFIFGHKEMTNVKENGVVMQFMWKCGNVDI